MSPFGPSGPPDSLRGKTYSVIFGHDDLKGQAFDGVLIIAILASVLALMLDSVASIHERHTRTLLLVEWGFTLLFTLEYLLRLWCVRRKWAYARSFFGVIDLLSVLPTYVSLILPGGQFLVVVRILRVVRVFRVFKLVRFLGEANVLTGALRRARFKIVVFVVAVLCAVVVVGSVMFVIEGPASGFTSIPRGVYWAIVTLTTVGYGDIAPQTPIGQAIAAFVMVLGYGIIAVPTGIVTAELTRSPESTASGLVNSCPGCERMETDLDARFCRFCGTGLDAPSPLKGAQRDPEVPPVGGPSEF
ncbi:MAG: ion transporter [Gemmatimonadota bacterium]|nr:ion transporter [Gemmatimonadota bacterium]